ncbi:hypothetical protein [Citrobacter tructae]|uniref:hypothetical protein n=1 Tax=Citrobacter tructae TaxID=2562449 RepID=UPI003F571B58
MYVLALVASLSGDYIKSDIIGAYTDLKQCEVVSETYSSRAKCFYLDPKKGLQDVNSPTLSPSPE